MKQFTPWEYVLIDLANSYGLDKETYETRINWSKGNLDRLEEFYVKAEEPYLYRKAVKTVRDIQLGKPVGSLVRFDAVCSGIQLLSVLTRCKSGCEATGAIDTGVRPNAYLQVQSTMQDILGEQIEIDYKSIKESVMTACYGSTAVPKKHFNGQRLEAFYKACRKVAPGAFAMLPVLKNTWNSEALAHEWVMPDGYHVYIPVMQSDVIDLEITELEDFTMRTFINFNAPQEFGVANVANVTHSIDGYVLRALVRMCNYDRNQVEKASSLIEAELIERSIHGTVVKDCGVTKRAKELNLLDISLIDTIDSKSVQTMSDSVLQLLMKDINMLLEHEPFEVVPVHDCFGCSPIHMNRLRKYYNEILARLSNSNLLEDIVSQLMGRHFPIKVFEEDISELIRDNDYAIN